MSNKKKVLLFSTLNPYPFWAGSENFWFDFVLDERTSGSIQFTCVLAKSPKTIEKGKAIEAAGGTVEFYDHFNVSFGRRNLYKLIEKVRNHSTKILPWYDRIKNGRHDLVWFNVAGLDDLLDLKYAVSLCKRMNIPYWLILQHGFEDFFLTTREHIETVTSVATGAEKFIFIADRNRLSLERAIGCRLTNAIRSVNALNPQKLDYFREISLSRSISTAGTAKFFNLGRFSPKDKAQHLIVQALSQKEWDNRDWQLSFVGIDDFGKYYLQKMVKYFGLNEERLSFISFTNSVGEIIGSNDVLIMPSIAEGTPYAMIESMACGRPALGTPIGGIPELVVNGKTGWLAEGIEVEAIQKKMEDMWNDREHWENYGKQAQRNINEKYSQHDSHLVLLNNLLQDIVAV